MVSTTITTITKMVEELPEPMQAQIADHLRHYIQELRDEMKWDQLFAGTQNQLIAAAQRARQEIENGLATPLDENRL
ncbi:MAG TPA: hypothetical protein PLD20_28340 [Blastocatellia bacterium]|nr:hypothetical protein [Blastocatellia bacterium]HMV84561.1 hypothetical protein [Blastocatellia bacterium]HMX27845.1 hypothetical protein [Blastocatellia bacterium]HMY73337.1 hypothetical protein [Blastocatellia bacterium]HMZ21875.1 hypothetical protein [Blastocatellia bacterium]